MSLKYFLPFALHSLCQARKSEIGTHAETPAHKSGLFPAITSEVYPPPDAPKRKILFLSTLVFPQANSTALTISPMTSSDPVAWGVRLGPRKSGCRYAHPFFTQKSSIGFWEDCFQLDDQVCKATTRGTGSLEGGANNFVHCKLPSAELRNFTSETPLV